MTFRIPQKKLAKYSYLWLFMLLLVTFALFYRVNGFGWINGTDEELIIRNPLLYFSAGSSIADIFLSTPAGNYQPLSILSLGLDMLLYPENPLSGIHLTNLILHMLNLVLFFRLAYMLFEKVSISLFATCIMAFHPVLAGTVAWMSSRGILLSSFFTLLALIAYLYSQRPDRENRKFRMLSLIFYLLALLSHPVAIAFTLLLITIDIYRGIPSGALVKGKSMYIMPGIAMLIVAVASQYFFAAGLLPWAGIAGKMLIAPYSSAVFLLEFLVPLFLSPYHPWPDNIMFAIFGLCVLMTLTGLFLFLKQNSRLMILLATCLILAIIVGLMATRQDNDVYTEDHIYYAGIVISTGIAFILKYLTDRFRHYKHIVTGIVIFAVLYTASLAYAAHLRIDVWLNSESFWSDVIEKYPDDGHAFLMRADYYAMNGDFEKAKFDYQQCIRRDPAPFVALNNLGLIYMNEGDLPMALVNFNKSIDIESDFYKSHLNKGITLMRLSRHDEALESMDRAADINPSEALIYYNRGLVFERVNALDDAIKDFTLAIGLNPGMLQFYKDRGKAYVWKQDFDAAEKDYSFIIKMDPSNAEMWFRRSLARTSQGKYKEGLEDALRARSLGFPVEEEYIRGISVQALKDDLPVSK